MKDFAQIWPGWEVVRKIGSGSFGAVYEIRRAIRGRTEHAAVKVLTIPQSKSEITELRADGYDDESITQYFADSLDKIEGEYAMMADMKGHSNVVYCDDLRTEAHEDGFGWDIYIKMELLSPLKSVLREDASQEQAVKLGIDMCGALELCEKMNIVHRDIKPENIFVSRDGTFKLGDFGIARTMEGTTGGTKTGTYDYMAPEVYNNRPYHTQADIYSLGLVLYWILNERTVPFLPIGTRPTPSVKSAARERRFSGEAIPAPVNGSDALKAIVLKACAYDPKDRYQSAAEMREDLKKLDTGAVFVPPVVAATPAEPASGGEGTVNIFSGKKEISPEEGTVNIFGDRNAEEKTEYIKDERTEYIRDEETEYVPRAASIQREIPKEKPKKKKLWLFPVIAIVLVIAILLLMLRSCGAPAGPGETTGSTPGTTQTDSTTAPEDTTAPSTGETTVPPTTDGTVPPTTIPPTTAPGQTVPPTTVPPVTQPADATLSSISVTAKPGKTAYYVGDTLNTAGLTLKLIYSDGSSQTVTSGFICNPTKLNTAGNQKITVTYSGKTATFDVSVSKVEVSKVAIKTNPANTRYTVGEALNTAGLSLTVTYNNGSTKTVSSGFTCNPTTLSTAGEQTVTVTYEGKTAAFTVTVVEVVKTGSCGDNLTFVLTSDGHLEITGSGAMYDFRGYGSSDEMAPWDWANTKINVVSVSLPEGLTSIGENAFASCRFTQIHLPDSLTEIGYCAFNSCSKLESIELPAKMTKLDNAVFYYCTALKSVSFGGVTTIEGSPFGNCTSLVSITIPAQVTSMAGSIFSGCENLKDIYILNPNCVFESRDGYPYPQLGIKGQTAIHGYAGSTAEAYAAEKGYTFRTIN